jgi:hypothetical protein
MPSRLRSSLLVISFSLGTASGASVVALQTSSAFQQGPGPIIEQTSYYAKAGMAEAVYQQRIHASEIRQKIGLPPGQVFRRVGGTGDLPNADAMERDLDVRAQSREFEEVRVKMRTLYGNFSRGFYQPTDRK